MNLMDKIEVNTRYTRSANLERDLDSQSIVEAYLPTPRGVRLLEDVAGTLKVEDQPRAWCLIGPYGCGKSSFGLFLHGLFGGNGKDPIKKAATKALANTAPDLAKTLGRQKPWCRVVLTGTSGPLSRRLLVALDEAAKRFWDGQSGRKPAVLEQIQQARRRTSISDRRLLELIDALQTALEKKGAGGLLILIDELGKFLEHEVRKGTGGMFLLQELAERAYRGRKANMMLFVFLHQAFDLYTRGMGEKLKNDWAKVQGRFQSISFIEAPEQTLRIIAAAFSNTLSDTEREAVAKRTTKIANALGKAKMLPGSLEADEAAEIFAACYPMHPIVLLTLPVLCQRFAQNERTLFSYLGSSEPHGFSDSMQSLQAGEWIGLSEVYDYFIQNQPAVLTDPLTYRRWAEVLTAVDRAEQESSAKTNGESQSSLQLVKSIGLLNLISGNGGLRASGDVLSQLYPTKKAFQEAIKQLLEVSIIQYRKFSDEYRVWQGTDFNIDEQVQLESEKLGDFGLAEVLRGAVEPIIARRHSAEKGALRYFDIVCVDARSLEPAKTPSEVPRVVFFLAEDRDDEEIFNKARKAGRPCDVWALYKNSTSLRDAIGDVLALENVQQGAQELASDPVASREIKERLKAARIREQDMLGTLLNQPDMSDWYWQGNPLEIPDQSTLQPRLSDVMDVIFERSPLIRNELINRDTLSTQAAAARNKLFHAMLDHADKPGLAIEKYPPERAIYRSVFEKGEMHIKQEADWTFVEPSQGDDPLRLSPTWERLDKLLAKSESEPMSTKYLMDELAKPPIGLKRGFFPIAFLHYYLVRGHEIAFYDEGTYSPVFTYEHLERMVRRPDLFSFQRFRIDGVRASLFDEYSKAIFDEVRDSLTVLNIARPLTQFVFGLDEYTQKTRRLKESTVRIRQAFFLSKSPEKLLFEELPKACGYGEGADLEGFAEAIIAALREMKNAHEGLLEEMRSMLCERFDIPTDEPLGELRTLLRGRCLGLDQYTVDTKGLKSLIRRIMDQEPTDEEWFAGLLLFLGHKPTEKWTDQDRDTATYRLAEFSSRMLELEKLRLHHAHLGKQGSDFEVILVKTISQQHGEIDEVVSLSKSMQTATAELRQKIMEALLEAENSDLALALIASVTQEYLAAHRQSQLTPSDGKKYEIREVG